MLVVSRVLLLSFVLPYFAVDFATFWTVGFLGTLAGFASAPPLPEVFFSSGGLVLGAAYLATLLSSAGLVVFSLMIFFSDIVNN